MSQFALNTLAYGDKIGWEVWLLEHYIQHVKYNTVLATSVSVIAIDLTNGGSNYSAVPGVVISGGSGSGATAVVAQINLGIITALALTSGGSGYSPSDSLTVTFTGGGTGSGAAANAVLANPVILNEYPIMRMDWQKHNLQEWLDSHEKWHEDVRPFANVTGVDLSIVDFSKPDDWYSWIDEHNQEHQFLDTAFGVS